MKMWWRVLALLLVVVGSIARGENDVELVGVEQCVDGRVCQDQSTFDEKLVNTPDKDPSGLDGKAEQQETIDFQAEIDALDEMIRLQEHKLRILAEIRKNTVASFGDSREDFRDLLERRLDAAVSEAAETSIGQQFDTYFVERATYSPTQTVADLKMLRVPGDSGVDLTVLAYTGGGIEFFASPLNPIFRAEKLSSQKAITSIALGYNNNHQIRLIVNHDHLHISVFSLELMKEGSRQQDTETQAKQLERGQELIQLHLQQLGKAQRRLKVTALAYMDAFDRIVLGFEDGSVEAMLANGTQLDSMQLGSTAIRGIASHHRRVAFSQGSNVVVTKFLGNGFARSTITCIGSNAAVTSLAFDTQSSDIVFAGTDKGYVLAFQFHWNSDQPHHESCKLLLRSPKSIQGSAIELKAIKGHVLAAGFHELVLYNASGVQSALPALPIIASLVSSTKEGVTPILFDFTQGVASSSFSYLESGPQRQELRLFHSLLSVPTEQHEVPWILIMYMGTAIAVVIGMQFVARRNTSESQTNPWDAPKRSPFAGFGLQKDRSLFGVPSKTSNRYNRRMAGNDYAVADAFEEPSDYVDGFSFDECQPTYHSLRDQLQERRQRRASEVE